MTKSYSLLLIHMKNQNVEEVVVVEDNKDKVDVNKNI